MLLMTTRFTQRKAETPASTDDSAPQTPVIEGNFGLKDREQRFMELIEREAFWVLEDDGRIVGHAAAPESTPGVLSIGMAVLAEARGRGGGRALLDAIKEHARSSGAHKISLEVWTDNARAIALYGAAGFEVEGLRRDHYRRQDGSLRSTLIMAWRVPAGDQ
jgi:ribosomal protein S18 acetylase RimI-like enzyme